MLDTAVARIVLEHSECATVFDRYRIDYCCRGELSLRRACAQIGLDPMRLLAECEAAIHVRTTPPLDLAALSTKELILHVIAPHHQYLHQTLRYLVGLAQKVARVHGDKNPTLADVATTVETLATTLEVHLDEEEQVLFPALLGGRPGDPRLLASMHADHDELAALLAQLRTVAADFRCPIWACQSYRALMAELAHLEADTLRHIHVEDQVLMPRLRVSRSHCGHVA